MRLFLLSTLLCVLSFPLKADDASGKKLSSNSQISILTCSPGEELYSLFGHTALRIKDSINQIDHVFNYGTFDFNTPNFYMKYVQGLLPYHLSVQPYQHFLYSYMDNNRSVFEQKLNLDEAERQALFEKLLLNLKPENRTYLYNFLFDNCSTRVRDMVAGSFNKPIMWLAEDKGISYWTLLDECLDRMPWASWGVHTLLGNPGNRQATPWEYMFLPEYLKAGLEEAETRSGQKIAEETEVLFLASPSAVSSAWYTMPWFVFWTIALVLGLIIYYWHNRAFLKVIVCIFFLISGLIGVLLVFLGGFTLHPLTAPNWNLLWACPINLLVAFGIWGQHVPSLIKHYLALYMGLLSAAVLVLILTMPAIPFSTLPIILFMGLLSARLLFSNIRQCLPKVRTSVSHISTPTPND